ncbi:MAG: hypothetical protein ACRDHD_10305 [Candidatus Limnocylindria bacterium]
MRRALGSPAPALLGLSLLVAACGGGPHPSGNGIVHPAGDQVVFRIEHSGGLLPADAVFTSVPAFSLHGDGRVIVPGAQVELFPGPALPAVNVMQLSESGIQAVLAAVAASGQFSASAEWRAAQNFVADGADTIFTMHADGREITVTVHGLGSFMFGEPPPDVPAAEVAAHMALSRLLERLTTLEAWLPAGGWAEASPAPYRPDAMLLLVRNADADPPDDSGIPPAEMPWPVDGDPADFGAPTVLAGHACGPVTGDEAAAWYQALSGANQLTRWTGSGHRYQVLARLLAPDEAAACPEGF